MNIFKKQTSTCSPAYRRSFSEPTYANTEIGTPLKIYQWCGPVKSKRKKNEYALSNPGKSLSAYRWQKHPGFRWKGVKEERLQNNKGDLGELQQKMLPEMVHDNASFSGNEVLATSKQKLNLHNQSLRAPFTRSISDPEPHCSVRSVRPWLTSVESVESEQQGYFIRSIFSTVSNGFSRMLSLKRESTNEPVREGIL